MPEASSLYDVLLQGGRRISAAGATMQATPITAMRHLQYTLVHHNSSTVQRAATVQY